MIPVSALVLARFLFDPTKYGGSRQRSTRLTESPNPYLTQELLGVHCGVSTAYQVPRPILIPVRRSQDVNDIAEGHKNQNPVQAPLKLPSSFCEFCLETQFRSPFNLPTNFSNPESWSLPIRQWKLFRVEALVMFSTVIMREKPNFIV